MKKIFQTTAKALLLAADVATHPVRIVWHDVKDVCKSIGTKHFSESLSNAGCDLGVTVAFGVPTLFRTLTGQPPEIDPIFAAAVIYSSPSFVGYYLTHIGDGFEHAPFSKKYKRKKENKECII